jgi:hypothetical protein
MAADAADYSFLKTGGSDNAVIGTLADETGLNYDRNYYVTPALYGGKNMALTVTYTSTTFDTSTFTDGEQSTGAITVVSTSSLNGKTITINGVVLTGTLAISTYSATTFGVDYPTTTATNIASAINANTTLSAIMTAEAIDTLVTATTTLVNQAYSYSSNTASITVVGTAFSGGKPAYYNAVTDEITIAAHGYKTALPVLYTQGAAIGGLTDQTTYYVISIDADTIQLATTSVKAFALDPINLNPQRSQISENSYTLSPLAITGTPSFKFQASNDSDVWADVNTSSITMSAYTAGGTTSAWDFEEFRFSTLKMAVIAPTTGAIYLKAVLTIKP